MTASITVRLAAVALAAAAAWPRDLPNGWRVEPAGRQVALDSFPVRAAVSPDGRHLLVLHAGRRPSLWVFAADTLERTDMEVLPDAGLGFAFTPGGRVVYVGGGASAEVYELSLSEEGRLEKTRVFSITDRGVERGRDDFAGDIQVSPDGRLVYVASLFRNQVLVINPQSGWVIERFPAPRRPYRILPVPDGRSFFLTSWAEGSVHQLDAASGAQINIERLGMQPMDMALQDRPLVLEEEEEPPPWKARLFVAGAAGDRIHTLAVHEASSLERLEPIRIALWPNQPLGMTPSALALSPDQKRLYVACSDANAVAVVDVSRLKCQVLGFVPAGLYPTAVAALAGGRAIALNGKGDGRTAEGSMSIFEPADGAALFQFTKSVLRLSPYSDRRMIGLPEIPLGHPVPPAARLPEQYRSPIRHLLFIVARSGAPASPNYDKLARDFVRFQNFSALGRSVESRVFWATAAIVPPFVERFAPSPRAVFPASTALSRWELAAVPPAGFLWTQAIQAGLAVRNYGFAVENHDEAAPGGVQVKRVLDAGLARFTEMRFRGPDARSSDMERAAVFLQDLERMQAMNDVPALMGMRLGPGAGPADHDEAIGRIVAACSRSRVWPNLAIFIVRIGDAGPGRLLVASPFARRGAVDDGSYDSTSVLRTMELILGLNPMTLFDAAAAPLWRSFQTEPDLRPYEAAAGPP